MKFINIIPFNYFSKYDIIFDLIIYLLFVKNIYVIFISKLNIYFWKMNCYYIIIHNKF